MNIVAIIQARTQSTRLPNKVLREINGTPLIKILLSRIKKSKKINKIIVAIPTGFLDDELASYIKSLGFQVYRGSENNVLSRYYESSRKFKADVIVRITADCPLVDSELIDECIQNFLIGGYDYYSNIAPSTFPDGLDIEVISFSALEKANKKAVSKYDKEHVTPFIRNCENFKQGNLLNDQDLSHLRWTVDESIDFDVVVNIYQEFYPEIYFSWRDVLDLYQKAPELFSLNKMLTRNQGDKISTGQKMWNRAKKVIPGGNMLLSKRPEMFLPDKWPSYYKKSKGCNVWDLDGNKYYDLSLMGVGTNILGYGHPEVDKAVRNIISQGNMSTLNCPEEVELAEKLIEIHPWAEMVKFARSGGEANAIAVRIARAVTGKDKIAICGYHGWHDWYLSANLADDSSLDGHLLPGLRPTGVPRELKGTVFPFEYNNYEGLLRLIEKEDIGIIKMEVSRNKGPENEFLSKIRTLATQKNIVLIFDECTSGFRETFGGLHKKYGVNPDIAIFGKALGNGYAISAIVGRRGVMEAAQSTFISSTFWTERIGSAAALKTLEVMERMKSWEIITSIGIEIRSRLANLANNNALNIKQWGIPALTGYNIESSNFLIYKTYITKKMLEKGFLASNSTYTCIAHTPEIIDRYFKALDPIFATIRLCEEGGGADYLLKSPVCHTGFKRLN